MSLCSNGAVFSAFLPQAETLTLQIDGQAGAVPLVKGDDGYFRATVPCIPGGFHYVHFTANGIPWLHPMLPVGYGYGETTNYIDLPMEDDMSQLKDVPHGRLCRELYWSNLLGRTRACWVYTPPAYTESRRYPVLYIQHGGGEDETGWFWQGKLSNILDNMINKGECSELIAVANHGNAYRETEPGLFTEMDAGEVITKECVPFIDRTYSTVSDGKHRAIAGLSMGGGQARHLAHTYPEIFGNLGVFSSGQGFLAKGNSQNVEFDYSELFATPERYNTAITITLVTCGAEDMRSAYTGPQVRELAEKGYHIEYREYPGGHEWNVWRASVQDFLRMIFKKKTKTEKE